MKETEDKKKGITTLKRSKPNINNDTNNNTIKNENGVTLEHKRMYVCAECFQEM